MSCPIPQPPPGRPQGLSAGRATHLCLPPEGPSLRCCTSSGAIVLLPHPGLPRASDLHSAHPKSSLPFSLPQPACGVPSGSSRPVRSPSSKLCVPAVWYVSCTTESVPRRKFLHLEEGLRDNAVPCPCFMFLRKRGCLGSTDQSQLRRHQFQAPRSEQVANSSLALCCLRNWPYLCMAWFAGSPVPRPWLMLLLHEQGRISF